MDHVTSIEVSPETRLKLSVQRIGGKLNHIHFFPPLSNGGFSFWPRTCRELAENLPSQRMPVSHANLLKPRDVRPKSSKGGWGGGGPPLGAFD